MYTLSLLDTTAKCDTVISKLTNEKAELEYKKEGSNRSKDSLLERGSRNEADLAATTSELTAVEAIIAGLAADSPIKKEMDNRKKTIEYRKWRLENGSASYDTILLKEAEVAAYQGQIDTYTNAIAAITAHKATL